METLFPGFVFPSRGWKSAGSDSYGTDELFHGIRHVLVRIFPEAEQALAYATHYFLKELGVGTASIDKITHVDGTKHYYVWGQRDQVLEETKAVVPDLTVEGRMGDP
jgi:hypothetical protein